MSDIPRDDPFWQIIAYLNENDMQGAPAKVWKTNVGYQLIFWGRHGWDRRMIDVLEWRKE